MEVIIKASLLEEDDSQFLLPIRVATDKKNELAQQEIVPSSLASAPVQTSLTATQINITPPSTAAYLDTSHDNKLLEAELEELKKSAYEEAYRDGYAKGLVDVKDRYNELYDKLEILITNIKDAIPEYIRSNESIVASIIFEAVTKIIGDSLVNKSQVIQIIRDMVAKVNLNTIQEVHVSPSDFKLLNQLDADLLIDDIAIKEMLPLSLFKQDSTITIGGCRLELKDGFIDASIDRQLKNLMKSLVSKVNEFNRI